MAVSADSIVVRDAVKEKVHTTVTHLHGYIDSAESHYSTLIRTLREKLRLLYESSIAVLENVENSEAVLNFKTTLHERSEEIISFIRSQRLHIHFHDLVTNIRTLVYKDLSRQALILGCAGLLTGGLIGVCVGYRFRSGSTYSPLSTQSNGNQYVMRAILTTSTRRGIDGITLTVVPSPTIISPDEVVVQVKAVGIDSIDTRIACGYNLLLRKHLGLSSVPGPWTLGRECSGIVVDVGNQVKNIEISDKVFVLVPIWAAQGVMSEFIVVPQKYVAPKPANISYEGAATMPYAFCTFWTEIVTKWNIGPQIAKNKRVLIHLGASTKNDGVGLLATQIFKSWGSRVTISTDESDNGEDDLSGSGVAQMTFLHSLKTLGAESHLIIPRDYSLLPNLTQRIFDIVINTDMSPTTPLLEKFCRDPESAVIETFPTELHYSSNGLGAFLASIVLFPFNFIFRKGVEEKTPPREILMECKKLVESRLLVPVVAKSFLPSQYDQAFRHVAKTSGSALAQANVGKCVLVFKSK
ncbi:unnamed protein product [Orchesella dallaii]|uniref:Enoyl reductase (ER) domain-containing protein n=1 Tax=Orchesella dallaii TaxID=48710 RepID=A0ABP1PKR5_9HEXA